MSAIGVVPWLSTAAGVTTSFAPPHRTNSFVPPSLTTKWSNDIVFGQPSGTAVSIHTGLTGGPFTSGIGKYSKFFSGSSGFMAAYGSTGEFTSVAGSSGGLWGSFTNEGANTIIPIFCCNQYTAADALALGAAMHSNYPNLHYYMCINQEANTRIKQGKSWPSGSLFSGAYTVTNVAQAYADLNLRVASFADPSKCKQILILTSYAQVNGPPAGDAASDFVSIFNSQGASIDELGVDVYSGNTNAFQGKPTSWTASGNMSWIPGIAASFGVPWSIPEFGVSLSIVAGDTDNDTKMSLRLNDIITYAQAHNAKWGAYWNDQQLYGLFNNGCAGASGDACNAGMASVPITLGVLQAAIAASS